MIIKSHPVHISRTVIDSFLMAVEHYLMDRYGVDQAARDLSPLSWYIETGRASLPFLNKLVNSRPYMIARKLHSGGSYEETINRIAVYLGEERN